MYQLLLDGELFGTTALERADPPMGVVSGVIQFKDANSVYDRVKDYCLKKGVKIVYDYPQDKLIQTSTIPNLVVMNEHGNSIEGSGANIEGMDSGSFDVVICGIPSTLYESEFSHHLRAYEQQFK